MRGTTIRPTRLTGKTIAASAALVAAAMLVLTAAAAEAAPQELRPKHFAADAKQLGKKW